MNNSLGQILEIKNLIDTKQFSQAKSKLKNLKSYNKLMRLFEFQIFVQNQFTNLKKFESTYYDNLKYFNDLGEKKFLILFHNLAGDYYFAQNKFGHAINDYDQCLKIDKGNTHAMMGLAKSYRLLGLYDISEKYYLEITHSYDWNLDNLESDIPLDYTSLREIISNKNFEFLPKNILVDIGVLYASNNENIMGNYVFEEILKNLPKTIHSSYFVKIENNLNSINDDLDKIKQNTHIPLSPKIKFITEIKNYFPDFYRKYKKEIEKGEFQINNKKNIYKILRGTVLISFNNSKLFIIEKKNFHSKKNFYYTVIVESDRTDDIKSAFYLYLHLLNNDSIINLIDIIKIEYNNTGLAHEDVLLFYLESLRDYVSIFLLKKKLYDKGYSKDYPFNYLKKSNQIIKIIKEDKKFENELDKLNLKKLNSFKQKFEESWCDYSKLPDQVKIEDASTLHHYNKIIEYIQNRLNNFKDENKMKEQKQIR